VAARISRRKSQRDLGKRKFNRDKESKSQREKDLGGGRSRRREDVEDVSLECGLKKSRRDLCLIRGHLNGGECGRFVRSAAAKKRNYREPSTNSYTLNDKEGGTKRHLDLWSWKVKI